MLPEMVELVEVELGNAFRRRVGADFIMGERKTRSVLCCVVWRKVAIAFGTSSMVWTGLPSMAIKKA
jgi:hypothetical protein